MLIFSSESAWSTFLRYFIIGLEPILDYCGGFVEGHGKYGNNPLIIGRHESCPECGKLICEKCSNCKKSWSFFEYRMNSINGIFDFNLDNEIPF